MKYFEGNAVASPRCPALTLVKLQRRSLASFPLSSTDRFGSIPGLGTQVKGQVQAMPLALHFSPLIGQKNVTDGETLS